MMEKKYVIVTTERERGRERILHKFYIHPPSLVSTIPMDYSSVVPMALEGMKTFVTRR